MHIITEKDPVVFAERKSFWMLLCFVLGTIWAALITPIQLAVAKNKYEKLSTSREAMLSDFKTTSIDKVLRSIKCQSTHVLKVRYFECKPALGNFMRRKSKKKVYLVIKKVPGVTDDHSFGLRFNASPHPEGIVGNVYKTGEALTQWNLQAPHPYQPLPGNVPLTKKEKFCAAYPIRDRKSASGKIVAILTLDCSEPMPTLRSDQELKFNTFVAGYGDFVEKHLWS